MALVTIGCSAEKKKSPSASDELITGTIARRPESGTEFTAAWQNSKGIDVLLTPDELGYLDLRCADLRKAYLTKMGKQLLNAAFDDQTKWPDTMPEDVDLKKLMELGKDPGLGVGKLQEQGITGKGVGIAIIDQTLMVDHQEYSERLRLYQEYNTAASDPALMHGAAVASIAVGKTVGVAPDALLYYIADDVGTGGEEDFVRDMHFYAKDIDRLITFNETLRQEEKIRVISMSVGYVSDTLGASEMDAAIARARAAGIAVTWVSDRDSLMGKFSGMSREPYGNPNEIESCRLGQYWEKWLYSGEYGNLWELTPTLSRWIGELLLRRPVRTTTLITLMVALAGPFRMWQ